MRKLSLTLALVSLLLLAAGPAQAVRIKDMASFKGVRGNQLVGYGLVVGLNGTGDKSATTFTVQGLANMLTRNIGFSLFDGEVDLTELQSAQVLKMESETIVDIGENVKQIVADVAHLF